MSVGVGGQRHLPGRGGGRPRPRADGGGAAQVRGPWLAGWGSPPTTGCRWATEAVSESEKLGRRVGEGIRAAPSSFRRQADLRAGALGGTGSCTTRPANQIQRRLQFAGLTDGDPAGAGARMIRHAQDPARRGFFWACNPGGQGPCAPRAPDVVDPCAANRRRARRAFRGPRIPARCRRGASARNGGNRRPAVVLEQRGDTRPPECDQDQRVSARKPSARSPRRWRALRVAVHGRPRRSPCTSATRATPKPASRWASTWAPWARGTSRLVDDHGQPRVRQRQVPPSPVSWTAPHDANFAAFLSALKRPLALLRQRRADFPGPRTVRRDRGRLVEYVTSQLAGSHSGGWRTRVPATPSSRAIIPVQGSQNRLSRDPRES